MTGSTDNHILLSPVLGCLFFDYGAASKAAELPPNALKLFDLLRDWRFLKEDEFREVYHQINQLPTAQSNALWERLRARLPPEDYAKLHMTYLAGSIKYVIFDEPGDDDE